MSDGQCPPGWYADPGNKFALRYWTGTAWTEHVLTESGERSTAALGTALSLAAPQPASPAFTPGPASTSARPRRWLLVTLVVVVAVGAAVALFAAARAGNSGRSAQQGASNVESAPATDPPTTTPELLPTIAPPTQAPQTATQPVPAPATQAPAVQPACPASVVPTIESFSVRIAQQPPPGSRQGLVLFTGTVRNQGNAPLANVTLSVRFIGGGTQQDIPLPSLTDDIPAGGTQDFSTTFTYFETPPEFSPYVRSYQYTDCAY